MTVDRENAHVHVDVLIPDWVVAFPQGGPFGLALFPRVVCYVLGVHCGIGGFAVLSVDVPGLSDCDNDEL